MVQTDYRFSSEVVLEFEETGKGRGQMMNEDIIVSFRRHVIRGIFSCCPGETRNACRNRASKAQNGMVKRYENGRKQKVSWHKQQKDPHSLLAWVKVGKVNRRPIEQALV